MADKKDSKKEIPKIELDPELLKAAGMVEDTINKASEELSKIANEMLGLASQVKEEYGAEFDTDALNELSSSITQIHEDSPYLDEIFKGDSWKKVIKTPRPDVPIKKKFKKKGDEDEKKS
tara:strand:+ start:133 stop:492 length:360 start_codon:yes stop_codon:yes gene_type:complete